MPHCTNDYPWYITKFTIGFVGLIFLYMTFLKERVDLISSKNTDNSAACADQENVDGHRTVENLKRVVASVEKDSKNQRCTDVDAEDECPRKFSTNRPLETEDRPSLRAKTAVARKEEDEIDLVSRRGEVRKTRLPFSRMKKLSRFCYETPVISDVEEEDEENEAMNFLSRHCDYREKSPIGLYDIDDREFNAANGVMKQIRLTEGHEYLDECDTLQKNCLNESRISKDSNETCNVEKEFDFTINDTYSDFTKYVENSCGESTCSCKTMNEEFYNTVDTLHLCNSEVLFNAFHTPISTHGMKNSFLLTLMYCLQKTIAAFKTGLGKLLIDAPIPKNTTSMYCQHKLKTVSELCSVAAERDAEHKTSRKHCQHSQTLENRYSQQKRHKHKRLAEKFNHRNCMNSVEAQTEKKSVEKINQTSRNTLVSVSVNTDDNGCRSLLSSDPICPKDLAFSQRSVGCTVKIHRNSFTTRSTTNSGSSTSSLSSIVSVNVLSTSTEEQSNNEHEKYNSAIDRDKIAALLDSIIFPDIASHGEEMLPDVQNKSCVNRRTAGRVVKRVETNPCTACAQQSECGYLEEPETRGVRKINLNNDVEEKPEIQQKRDHSRTGVSYDRTLANSRNFVNATSSNHIDGRKSKSTFFGEDDRTGRRRFQKPFIVRQNCFPYAGRNRVKSEKSKTEICNRSVESNSRYSTFESRMEYFKDEALAAITETEYSRPSTAESKRLSKIPTLVPRRVNYQQKLKSNISRKKSVTCIVENRWNNRRLSVSTTQNKAKTNQKFSPKNELLWKLCKHPRNCNSPSNRSATIFTC